MLRISFDQASKLLVKTRDNHQLRVHCFERGLNSLMGFSLALKDLNKRLKVANGIYLLNTGDYYQKLSHCVLMIEDSGREYVLETDYRKVNAFREEIDQSILH